MVKNLPANAGDIRYLGLIPGSGRSPGEEHGNLLQYSCLEDPMDRGVKLVDMEFFTGGQGLITPWSENLIQSLSGRMLCFAFFCVFNPQVDSNGFQCLRTTNAQEWSTSLIFCQR